LSEKVSP
jgi:hypothetical protein